MANVVSAHAFGNIQGVTVDTHVRRLTNLIGLTKHQDPIKIEQDLMKLLPKADWENFSIMTIYHGRAICNARKPNCPDCELAELCPSANQLPRTKPKATANIATAKAVRTTQRLKSSLVLPSPRRRTEI